MGEIEDIKKEENSFEEEKVKESLNQIDRISSFLPSIVSPEKRDTFIAHEIIVEQTPREDYDLSRTFVPTIG